MPFEEQETNDDTAQMPFEETNDVASVLMQHNLRLNSNGAPRAAMCGVRKAAATIQSAETKVKATKELVGGSTTSQVE